MVTPEDRARAEAIHNDAKLMIEWAEKLLEQVVLEIPFDHHPVRRRLALWDPVASNGGSQLPFASYKKAVDQILDGKDQLLGVSFTPVSDETNDGFRSVVQQLQAEGMSESDAVGAASGSLNLDMLAEGVLPALMSIFKKVLPQMPLGGDLEKAAGPIADWMALGTPDESIAGNPTLALAAKDVVDRVKSLAKASVGIQHAAMREMETAPQAVVSYAIGTAANKTGEFHPARIWHVWATYPQLRKVELQARHYIQEPVGTVHGDAGAVLDYMYDGLRELAVMYTSSPATIDICCLVRQIAKNPEARAIINHLRQVLELAGNLSIPAINLQLPTMASLTTSFKSMMATQILRRINDRFNQLATDLRESWQKLAKIPCVSLDRLFDAVIQILSNLRIELSRVALKWMDGIKIGRRAEKQVNLRLLDQLYSSWHLQLFADIDAAIDWAAKCGLNGDRRFADQLSRLAQDSTLKVHRRGQPLPDGANELSPLINLDPITTPNGFIVEPGIQSAQMPIGELAELFKTCKTRPEDAADKWVKLPAQIRRPV